MACLFSVIGDVYIYIYICMELEVVDITRIMESHMHKLRFWGLFRVLGDMYIRICIYRVFRVTGELGFE